MESIPRSSPALRERGKARRHGAIVEAASALWRDRGMENVSLAEIAVAAEVAPQTIYNLIGGIDAIGFEVIKAALNKLDAALAQSSTRGVDRALETAHLSAKLYIEDARLYRQLLVRVPRMLFEGTHLGRDLTEITVQAMEEAQAAGQIAPAAETRALGRAIYSAYLGALYEWAYGDAVDEAFLIQAEIAVLSPIVACATEAARPALADRLLERLSGRKP